jgi:hypothetical protein
MIDWLRGVQCIDEKTRSKPKMYKPYEVRAFKTGEELIDYFRKPLVKYTLVNNPDYGPQGYQQLLDWAVNHKDGYNWMMTR